MRDGIALARHVNLLSALTSEIRRATNTGEIRHFANPVEFRRYCDPASWHSTCSVKSVDVLGYATNGSIILTLLLGRICHEGSNEGYRVRRTLRASVYTRRRFKGERSVCGSVRGNEKIRTIPRRPENR